MVQPGIEPGTFRVWGERDNHYTTEPRWFLPKLSIYIIHRMHISASHAMAIKALKGYNVSSTPQFALTEKLS